MAVLTLLDDPFPMSATGDLSRLAHSSEWPQCRLHLPVMLDSCADFCTPLSVTFAMVPSREVTQP